MANQDLHARNRLLSLPNPEGPLPPLPDPIPLPDPQPAPFPEIPPELDPRARRFGRLPLPWPGFRRLRSLREGCYLARFTPRQLGFWVHYDGTIRVERDGAFNTIASGDLYLHRPRIWPWQPPRPFAFSSEPNAAAGIPVFPRSRYRYYLRITQILESFTFSDGFELGYERHRFEAATNSWTNEGPASASLEWKPAPPGYPSSSDYLEGDVKDASGAILGRLSMGWVSPHLRKATIEIDRVKDSEAPQNSGTGVDWGQVMEAVGWDVTVVESDTNVAEPSGAAWSDAEMHSEMLAIRDSSNLDTEWRYHLLCVRRLDSTSRGIMYDAYGGDSNNIPREGAGISSHWQIPNQLRWGQVRGVRFGAATAPYFRTAVHELGHAMGLYHNTVDNGFMNTTGVIADNATPGDFPNNVQWAYATDDQKRLRHMPDIWVRPGGIPFGSSYTTAPISPDDLIEDADGLAFQALPLHTAVPIGAPVRIDLALENVTQDQPLPAPSSLSLKSGFVKGKVVDPSGTVRTFWPLVRCLDEDAPRKLDPGERLVHSITLLRGAQGALFPTPGMHTVIVELSWHLGATEVGLRTETRVMVTPPVDADHAEAALRVLSSPDALLTLAFGGDHLEEGIDTIRVALDNPVLRPHFGAIEAKRVGRRFHKRSADPEAAAKLLDEDTVMSGAEIGRLADVIGDGPKGARSKADTKRACGLLKQRVEKVAADRQVVAAVKDL